MSVHLYLVTDLAFTCFAPFGKQCYMFLCDECAKELSAQLKDTVSFCKETEVSAACEECTKLCNKERWDYEETGMLPTRDWDWFKELKKINGEGGRGV